MMWHEPGACQCYVLAMRMSKGKSRTFARGRAHRDRLWALPVCRHLVHGARVDEARVQGDRRGWRPPGCLHPLGHLAATPRSVNDQVGVQGAGATQPHTWW